MQIVMTLLALISVWVIIYEPFILPAIYKRKINRLNKLAQPIIDSHPTWYTYVQYLTISLTAIGELYQGDLRLEIFNSRFEHFNKVIETIKNSPNELLFCEDLQDKLKSLGELLIQYNEHNPDYTSSKVNLLNSMSIYDSAIQEILGIHLNPLDKLNYSI